MKAIGNILAISGILLFVYTVIGRFIGAKCVLGHSQIPVIGKYIAEGFSATGMFAGIACILLIAVIALLKSE